MLLDFKDMLADATKKGMLSTIVFCLREARDIPLGLVSIHLEENRMLRVFRFQPVNLGLRSAFAFGGVYALVNVIIWSFGPIWEKSVWRYDHYIPFREFYYGIFHTRQGFELIYLWIPFAINSLLIGFVMGLLFAILFGNRASYSRYILVGTVGWFLQDSVRSIFSISFIHHHLAFPGNIEYERFGIMASILSGAILGLIFLVAKNERPGSLRLMGIATLAYPSIACVFSILVFFSPYTNFNPIEPWRYISLAILMILFIEGIVFIAMKSVGMRRLLWVIVAGALGKLTINYLLSFVALLIFGPSFFWSSSDTEMIENIRFTIWDSVDGILFGLLLGVVLGVVKKNTPTRMLASS